ncbi:translation elongation factor Ts [Streptococcus merionis]|uniref:Elongation factor Ts n=1 Tax=Streptococcus merionis TaxID=400065 RepID=A0A239T262_9STRE|nr:translation elongation factor Ts [Streptococcus merionis]SNU91178.1 elongation factor Ts [Streptococcus merionis]
MAEITAKLVKELREKSGAGVMDAKKALVETDGDIDKAVELLREKGMAKAAKKADRVAAEGLTGVFVEGNTAAVVEVNSETDFVAKNDQFVALVKEAAEVIAKGKPASNEEALALTVASGETLEAAFVTATATIGEKISFRRFALIEKTDDQVFGAYQHNGGRIGVISVIEGGDEALAKQVSMHIAAMKPTVLSYTELDEQFVKDELAQLNHKIEQDNESRAMVDKPALPLLKYGSKAQLTEDVLAQAEADIKAELAAEGKPEKIWDKIIPGKMDRFMLDNTQVDQAYTLLSQVYIMDDSKTVEAYLDSVNAKVVDFKRFEVGDGIEKASNDFEAEVAATMAAALGQ